MSKNLVIVESPAKAKTIHKILGKDYEVTSSMGHLVDLPSSTLGVDVEKDFQPKYIVIQKRRKIAKEIQEKARGRAAIFLAPDPDREGEAISWHLRNLFIEDEKKQAHKKAKKDSKSKSKKPSKKGKKSPEAKAARKIYRITFHEITPEAIQASIKHPADIDLDKVNAQQARRILDRLFGYSLSPLLWKKIGRGLSAGRVQSVALRLIVEREKEIEAFKPQEYWTVDVALAKSDTNETFKARLETEKGKKLSIKNKEEAHHLSEELKKQKFIVSGVDEKRQNRYPKPPFTTSTLQQEAFNKLGFSSARTMRIAQQLYEGIEIGKDSPVGLITYMRTDSVHVASDAISSVRSFISSNFGKDYMPESVRLYKSKKLAQEAHEAIRPTSVSRSPESIRQFLNQEQFELYELIWQRFIASQMSDAVDNVTSVNIEAGIYGLKVVGRRNVFDGWTRIYRDEDARPKEEDTLPENVLPKLSKGDLLKLLECLPGQHFTKPPRRYTDASLVKALEEQGIGRPSTYAPTIQTIVSRDYVRRTGGSLIPTHLGRTVTEMLIEHFPEIMDIKFTAGMEEELDRIEEGDMKWIDVVRHFYTPFSSRIDTAHEHMKEVKREVIPTSYTCDKCQKPMVIKWGRFGQFLSCSGFPECKNARPIPSGVMCPQEGCGGELIQRKARGRYFYGCSKYPGCTYTTQKLPNKSE